MSRFIAIDVETANSKYSSICQIGIVEFQDGIAINRWKTYVNPESRFSARNVSIHGISREHVKNAPKFPEALSFITPKITNQKLVYHTHFDRTALHQAAEKYNLKLPECSWIDSSIVARATWTQFKYAGFGLDNLAYTFGIPTENRHDAEADAHLAGIVFLKALADSNTTIEKWEKVCASNYRKAEWKKQYTPQRPAESMPPHYVDSYNFRKQPHEVKRDHPKLGILWVIFWPFYASYKFIKWTLAEKSRRRVSIIVYSLVLIGLAIICQLLFFDFIIYLIKDQRTTLLILTA